MKLTRVLALMPLVAAAVADPQSTVRTARKGQDITPFDSQDFCSLSITNTCNTTIAYIDGINAEVRPALVALVRRSYFKYFKLNLFKSCPYWKDEGFCVNRNCAVDFIEDWESLNETYQPDHLGAFTPTDELGGSDSESDDNNYCYLEDDTDAECQMVSLVDNPERFTGYGGDQSAQVWNYIYRENCFPDTTHMDVILDDAHAATCVEKRLFYRLVSGMHASIAVHLSHQYLNTKTGAYLPNLALFMERVGNHPDRVANVYFNFAVVSQAVAKLLLLPLFTLPHVQQHNQPYIEELVALMKTELATPLAKQSLFDGSLLFQDPSLKNEFRDRFRNVSAIMDCVGCDRCRLWGKIQTTGYGTALKVLFEMEADSGSKVNLKKQEVVALLNTFARLSTSVAAINDFKALAVAVGEGAVEESSAAVLPGMEADLESEFEEESGDEESDDEGEFVDPFAASTSEPLEPAKEAEASVEAETSIPHKEAAPKRKGQPAPHAGASKRHNPYLKQSHIRVQNSALSGLKESWNMEMRALWEALKFMGRSYLNLPSYIYKSVLYRCMVYWNWFTGTMDYDYEQAYLNLFQ